MSSGGEFELKDGFWNERGSLLGVNNGAERKLIKNL